MAARRNSNNRGKPKGRAGQGYVDRYEKVNKQQKDKFVAKEAAKTGRSRASIEKEMKNEENFVGSRSTGKWSKDGWNPRGVYKSNYDAEGGPRMTAAVRANVSRAMGDASSSRTRGRVQARRRATQKKLKQKPSARAASARPSRYGDPGTGRRVTRNPRGT